MGPSSAVKHAAPKQRSIPAAAQSGSVTASRNARPGMNWLRSDIFSEACIGISTRRVRPSSVSAAVSISRFAPPPHQWKLA